MFQNLFHWTLFYNQKHPIKICTVRLQWDYIYLRNKDKTYGMSEPMVKGDLQYLEYLEVQKKITALYCCSYLSANLWIFVGWNIWRNEGTTDQWIILEYLKALEV